MPRGNGGKIVTDDEIVHLLETVEERCDRPVTSATEIANELGVTRQAAHKNLQDLADEGRIRRYKPGKSVVWWVDD